MSTSARRIRRLAGAGSIGFMALALLAFPATTLARGGDAVLRAGECSGNSTSKIKAKHDDGRIEVEFEVDSNHNGQTWNVALKHNGTRFWSGQRTTQAPSGSFEVAKRTSNAAGTDTLRGRATNPATGEVCIATVSI